MKDAVIFDLDGTLWDSSFEVATAWSGVTEGLASPFSISREEVLGVMGLPMDSLFIKLFKGRVPKESEAGLIARLEEAENAYLREHPGKLFPQVPETLEALGSFASLYIVSNCQKGYIEAFLAGTGLGPLFAGHLSFGDTGEGKELNLPRLIEREGISRAFYLGDTEGDYRACQKAAVPFLFASYGFGETKAPDRIGRFEDVLPFARAFIGKGGAYGR